jgi:glucan phosphoethanolaminetransferase (alkaline phosphatase superfamily)
MIQRIQSIYLMLIVICQSLLFATALATFTSYETSFNLSLMGFYKLSSAGNDMLINSYSLVVVNILVILFSLFVIFSFKNRKKQIKLAAFNFLLICSFVVLMFYSFDNAKSLLDNSYNTQGSELSTTYGIGMILPILSLIFNFLAIKGIRKDEELVRSADRIR